MLPKRDLMLLAILVAGGLGLAQYLGLRQPPINAPAVSFGPAVRTAAAQLDREFRDHWTDHSLNSAGPADLLTIARRLSLAMTGTIPSLEEIRWLEHLPSDNAIPSYVDRLLHDRRHADYLAERLARVFVGVEGGPFIVYRRHRFVSWLSDQLMQNVPYDQLARELITAKGLWTDQPQVNFLTVTVGGDNGDRPDEKKLAARVSRSMLGVRLDCVQCHDDNLGADWRQSDFHQLAAFFSEATPTFAGLQDLPHEYQIRYLHETEDVVVTPTVPFAQQLFNSDGSRREQLAGWVTHPENRSFARTLVNRIWALAFGKPLVEPVDNIPLEGEYPPGLEYLAGQLVQQHYDLHWLWKVIAASEVFQASSAAPFEVAAAHEQNWAVFPLTRLRPEQVAGALVQSARLQTINVNSHILLRLARINQSRDFVMRYGDIGEDEFSQDGGTVPQRLLMLNGDLVQEKTKDDLVMNAATRIQALAATPRDALDAAYLVTLTRRPSATEAQHFLSLLEQQYKDSSQQWGEHIAWCLINSTEFSWNH